LAWAEIRGIDNLSLKGRGMLYPNIRKHKVSFEQAIPAIEDPHRLFCTMRPIARTRTGILLSEMLKGGFYSSTR
jgi:hypothetical protein